MNAREMAVEYLKSKGVTVGSITWNTKIDAITQAFYEALFKADTAMARE